MLQNIRSCSCRGFVRFAALVGFRKEVLRIAEISLWDAQVVEWRMSSLDSQGYRWGSLACFVGSKIVHSYTEYTLAGRCRGVGHLQRVGLDAWNHRKDLESMEVLLLAESDKHTAVDEMRHLLVCLLDA